MYTVQLTGLRAPTQIINSVKALRSYTTPLMGLKEAKETCDALRAGSPVTVTLDLDPRSQQLSHTNVGSFLLSDYFEYDIVAIGEAAPTISLDVAKVALSAMRDHMLPCDLRSLAKALPTSADILNKAADLMEQVP